MIDTTRGQKAVVDRFLGLADGAPYCAKAAGRNRIEVAFTPA
jgi:PleD family two-component response regulator